MATLLSCQPPPPSGYVTVLEHECQFVSCPQEGGGGGGREREGLQSRSGHAAATSSLQTAQRMMNAVGVQVERGREREGEK